MKKVIVYFHTHWDREWYREFDEFRLRLVEVVDDILDKSESGELPVFYFDGQTAALEDFLEIRPEKVDLIKQLIKQKKIFTGPFYCSPDEFLVSGEGILRNLYFGISASQRYGCSDFIMYLSDTFGHSRFIPSVAKSVDIDKAVLWRGLGDLPADILWSGIKTVNLIQGYFQDFLHNFAGTNEVLPGFKKCLDKISAKSGDIVLLPVGADHLKIPDNISSLLEILNEKFKGEYKFVIGSPFDYFAHIRDDKIKSIQGEFRDNSLTFVLPGVYSARVDIKQAAAVCDRELINTAEPFQALNSFFFAKKSMQAQCDAAYKLLIKNHAHDSIYGCSLDNVSLDVLNRFKRVKTIAGGITQRCIRDLSNNEGFGLVNLSGTNFSGVVSFYSDKKPPKYFNAVKISTQKGFPTELLYDCGKIPVTEDYTDISEYLVKVENIAAISFADFDKHLPACEPEINTGLDFIENKFIKIDVNNGNINITDKISGIKNVNFFNIFDYADIGDSYNFGALKDDKPIRCELLRFKIINLHLKAVIKAVYKINIPACSGIKSRAKKKYSHLINVNISLTDEGKTAEFSIDFTNKSENHKLQVAFNLNKPAEKTVSEDLFGTVERHCDYKYDVYSHVPAQRGKELSTGSMPVGRFIFSNGTAIFTDGLKEFEVENNYLKLTLLRAIGIISNPHNPTRGTPAGPPIPTPDMQLKKHLSFDFHVAFLQNTSMLYEIADNIFAPPIFVPGKLSELNLINIDNPAVRISGIKLSGSDLILHVFNSSHIAQTTSIKSCFGKLCRTDITETLCADVSGKLKLEPGEILFLKIIDVRDK